MADPGADPRADAETALEHYWERDTDGAPALPVDPIRIARNLGLDVYSSQLRNGTSGVLVKKHGGIPAIHLSIADAVVRQRFTCAHEIGHYWRKGAAEQNFGYIDKRDDLAESGTDAEENYANTFAAELLMPASAVTGLYRQGVGAERQAALFAVSLEAMRSRVDSLGLG